MICGILPLVKPPGPSSATVVNLVRRLTGVRHVGHAGTLDPAASGVLVLGFNQATRLFPYLPPAKDYLADILLGRTTDTLDMQGRVVSEGPVPDFSLAELQSCLQRFTGKIQQVPPMVCARHHQGRRLYRLARQGAWVERPARTVCISALALREWRAPRLTCEIRCSSGTYIRTLADDIGRALGCGACLADLVRTACSGFPLETAGTLDEFLELCQQGRWQERLLPPVRALPHLPTLRLENSQARAVQNGQCPVAAHAVSPDGPPWICLVDRQDRLLAIARARGPELVLERVFTPAQAETPCA